MKHQFIFLSATMLAGGVSGLQAASPYISRVYEYRPAPGQFVNELPEYEEGDTYADMLGKAQEQIAGERAPGMITLGAFGGYVVFGFDHPVANKAGEYDFKIYGNAIISDRDKRGGSSEPGVVMVSRDANGNGLPDDEWYELAGSEYSKPETKKGFSMSYFAPEAGHTPTTDPNQNFVTDSKYIRWSGSDGAEGYIAKIRDHAQPYWPQWLTDTQLDFKGTLLANNAIDIGGDGSYFVLTFYEWGYADNLPNSEDKGFNLDWAVDADGNPVKLESIDFVRVHTAVSQQCGRLGETSTEICGAEDLHPDYSPTSISGVETESAAIRMTSGGIMILSPAAADYRILTSAGATMLHGHLTEGENLIDTSALPHGIYLVHTPFASCKLIL